MIDDGLREEVATRRFWCVDRQGLLIDDMDDLRDFQAGYARPRAELSQWRTRVPRSCTTTSLDPSVIPPSLRHMSGAPALIQSLSWVKSASGSAPPSFNV